MTTLKNRSIAGVTVTPEHIHTAETNGINFQALSKRLQYGLPLTEAITRPLQVRPQGRQKEMFDAKEVKRIVGRIKYINRHEHDFPYPIPKPVKVKMQKLGIRLEDIEPVPVEQIV